MTAGSCVTSPGRPSARRRPWSSTTRRSASLSSACMVCSMMTTVTPAARTRRITAIIVSTPSAESPASGSSRRTRRGRGREAPRQLHQPQLERGEAAGHVPRPGPARPTCARAASAAARARPDGGASRTNAPTMTFSCTVRWGNVRTTWNVRPTPRRQSALGLRPGDGLRRGSGPRPASGTRKPLSTLNSVVLPAPLGPMMPRISPLAHSKLTSASGLQTDEGLGDAAHLERAPRPVARLTVCRRRGHSRRSPTRAGSRRGGALGARTPERTRQ